WHAIRDKTGYAVYLVAARRDMIDAIVAAVSSAGPQVERIDLKPLALGRGMAVSDGLLLEWAGAEATLVLMVKGRPRFFRTFALDAPADDPEAQLEELTHALNALVKFMRGTASDVPITPATTLALGGRFAFLPEGLQRAEQRFDFAVPVPTTRFTPDRVSGGKRQKYASRHTQGCAQTLASPPGWIHPRRVARRHRHPWRARRHRPLQHLGRERQRGV